MTKSARYAKTLGSCDAALLFALVVLGDGWGPGYSTSHGTDGTLPPNMPAMPDTLTDWVISPPESSLAKAFGGLYENVRDGAEVAHLDTRNSVRHSRLARHDRA